MTHFDPNQLGGVVSSPSFPSVMGPINEVTSTVGDRTDEMSPSSSSIPTFVDESVFLDPDFSLGSQHGQPSPPVSSSVPVMTSSSSSSGQTIVTGAPTTQQCNNKRE